MMFLAVSFGPALAAQSKLAENISAQEAYELIKGDPKIVVIDLRTPGEFQFMGYIEGAYNIPYWVFGEKFLVKDTEFEYEPGVTKKAPMNRYQFTKNLDFMKYVKELTKPEDTIILYCGSSARSAAAADEMVKAGYKNVMNMVAGLEQADGWKKSKLPLKYMMKVKDLDPKYVYPPDRQ